MGYQVRTIYVRTDHSGEPVQSEVVGRYDALDAAINDARITRDRLRASPSDGVKAVVEVVDWERDAVMWREAAGEGDDLEDQSTI